MQSLGQPGKALLLEKKKKRKQAKLDVLRLKMTDLKLS